MMSVTRTIVSALAFPLLVVGASATATAATEASEFFDLTAGDHSLSRYFGYEVNKARIMFFHATEGQEGKPRELLGTLPIDNIIIYQHARRAGFAVSDDGRTLLYVHIPDSPFLRPSPPKGLKDKPSGLYEYAEGRGDRLVHADVNLVGSVNPLARNAIRFARQSAAGTYVRTTEGEESVEDEIGWTPLHRAAFLGDTTAIQRLLREGAGIGAQDGKGFTPLHTAISNGQEGAAKVLIEAGADVNARPRTAPSLTPIHHAAWLGYTGIVAALLAKGVDKDQRDADGKSPLFDALWTGRYETATYLIKQGADLVGKDSLGNTPLHIFAALSLTESEDRSKLKAQDAAGSPREALLRLMIEKGADVNARNNQGATPLQIAMRNRRAMTTQVLLESGAVADPHDKRKD